MKNNEIKYIIPDFTSYGRNEILIDIINNHKNMVKDNVSIHSFYGTFSNAIWNGGRVDISLEYASRSHMKKVRDFYNKKGIAVTFTFTNPLIREEHLDDKFCNMILDVFHNGKNEVLVVSRLLEEYIRKNYPKYKINKSITFAEDAILDSDDKYNLVVINQNLNHNFEILKNIKCKDKIEILCDSICFDYCQKSKCHYTELAKIQLHENEFSEKYGRCKYGMNIPFLIAKRNKSSKNYISPEEVENIYAPMGFKYFKLSERDKGGTSPFIALDSIINHMIKKEYRMDVRIYIIERLLLERGVNARKSLKKYGVIPGEYL